MISLEEHIKESLQQIENYSQKKYLLATSGGVDSVVLAHLFHKLNLDFTIAHCNFQLRDKESDEDQLFVKNLSKNLDKRFLDITFDTNQYKKDHKLSTQEAARILRYEWFKKIRKEQKLDYIVTAHHANDKIETFFINLSRGAGIKGLSSIKMFNNSIFRPMLNVYKDQIIEYAKLNEVEFREDSSNFTDDYLRNKIRHHISPVLNQNGIENDKVFESITYLNETNQFVQYQLKEIENKIAQKENGKTIIPKDLLFKNKNWRFFLFEYLAGFGFNKSNVSQLADILKDSQKNGQYFYSKTHQLLVDRNQIIITDLDKSSYQAFLIEKLDTLSQQKIKFHPSFELHIKKITKFSSFQFENSIVVDVDKLNPPFMIRKWKEGDFLHPFGMRGKKKLSDFFIDSKLSAIQKKEVFVLEDTQKIIWVMPYRVSELVKVSPNTKNLICITLKRTYDE